MSKIRDHEFVAAQRNNRQCKRKSCRQQLPPLVRSIEQLSKSQPQPMTLEQISATVRPLLIEQYQALERQNNRRHAEPGSDTQQQQPVRRLLESDSG